MSKLKNILKNKKEITEFLRYLVIGFSTTFLNWGITIALKELTSLENSDIGATVITVIAWFVSTVFFAFWAYKLFVFRSKSLSPEILWKEFAGFVGARLITLGVESLVILVFCDLLGFKETMRFTFTRVIEGANASAFSFELGEMYIVKFCALVVTTILNYIFSKLIIFKKGQKLSGEKNKEE